MADEIEARLEQLLAESVPAAEARERQAFDLAASPCQDRLVLFGAGNQGRRILAALRSAGLEPLAFADNNSNLWNQEVGGVAVLPPEEAARRFGRDAAFVTTAWSPDFDFEQVRAQLLRLGCDRVVPLPLLVWKFAPQMLPDMYFDLPHRILEQAEALRHAFRLFREAASRHAFVQQVQLYLHGDPGCIKVEDSRDQYFPADLFSLQADDVFVDVGAFDGDTLRAYLARGGRHYVGLEPDPGSFEKLTRYVASLPPEARRTITLLPMAASNTTGTARFNATGGVGASLGEEGQVEVRTGPLDEILTGTSSRYLKFDVEGHEYEALSGARQTMQRSETILSVSIYHLAQDLWRLPALIAEMLPHHAYFLRCYCRHGMDLDMYAVPARRLIRQLR